MIGLLNRIRARRLGWLAELVRADVFCLSIRIGPVPFWPADHPAELEGAVLDEIDL